MDNSYNHHNIDNIMANFGYYSIYDWFRVDLL